MCQVWAALLDEAAQWHPKGEPVAHVAGLCNPACKMWSRLVGARRQVPRAHCQPGHKADWCEADQQKPNSYPQCL